MSYHDDPKHAKLLGYVGKDMARLRALVKLSQEDISEVIHDGNANRDWTSKLERGQLNISLYDYLQLMNYFLAAESDHPAKALLELYRMIPPTPKPPALKVVK